MGQAERGPTVEKMQGAYARWAPFYDLVYDRLTAPAAKRAVAVAMQAGPRILEVGVGTGLSLGYYGADTRVTGVDLSEAMLRRARDKVQKQNLTHVEGLQVMDATRLGFPDASFDAVVAQFVITLVPQPEKALDEFLRVLRPGGLIVFANHFGAEGPVLGPLEEKLAPLATAVGWSAGWKAERIRAWARRTGIVEIGPTEKVFPLGFFKILSLRKKG
jgi:phosphatidylethanolamine/phosphatidyl-N-methylethanolamine N-methyltransferase